MTLPGFIQDVTPLVFLATAVLGWVTWSFSQAEKLRKREDKAQNELYLYLKREKGYADALALLASYLVRGHFGLNPAWRSFVEHLGKPNALGLHVDGLMQVIEHSVFKMLPPGWSDARNSGK